MGFSREEAREEKGLIRYGKTVSNRYRGQEALPREWIIAQGEHKGLICQEDFLMVQSLLKKHRLGKRGEGRIQNEISLLSGLLYCSCGSKMRPKYYGKNQVNEEGWRKFSYRCICRDKTRGQACQSAPLPGNVADGLVWEFLLERTRQEISMKEIFWEIRRKTEKEKEQEKEKENIPREEARLEQEVRRLSQRLAETEDLDLAGFLEQEIRKRLGEREALRKREREKRNSFDRKERENLVRRYSDPEFFSSFLSVPNKRIYIEIWVKKLVWEEETGRLYLFVSPGPL